MDPASSQLYTIELWSQSGQPLADISRFCTNRSWSAKRNDVETLTFTLDLFEFERYCTIELGVNPATLIAPYVTDVKLKRGDTYLYGFQVVSLSFQMDVDSSGGSSGDQGGLDASSAYQVVVQCTGYLNLFKDRYTSNSYAQVERTAIATDLIRWTQALPYGDMGVTIGSTYVTGKLSDRNYAQDCIKDKLQQLAALTDSPFDFSFTAMKQFVTYSQIGARRSDISLIWGGPLSNVAGFALDRSGESVYNYIYGIGSGSGDVALVSSPGVSSDPDSMANYYRREKIDQFSTVSDQTTLDQDTLADLNLYKGILELPTVTITSNEIPVDASGVSQFLSVGDRIPFQVNDHAWLSAVVGLYRIEQMDVSLDDNDFETIQLTFDSWGVNQSEQ